MRFCSLFLVISCVAGIVACGGDDDAATPSSGNGCSGVQLTDDQLCKLTCKSTTPEQAQATLGTPSTSSTSSSTLYEYSYTCVQGSVGSGLSYDLYFSGGVLTSVGLTGTGTFAGKTLPACISGCKI